MTAPHFTMLWRESMPQFVSKDSEGRKTEVDVISGVLGDCIPQSPPPDSWAANPDNHVAIWVIKMAPNASWTLPAAQSGLSRTLYFYRGAKITVAGKEVVPVNGVELHSDMDALLENGAEEGFMLMLQGRPINEPVAQYGPFVMNTAQEIQQALADLRNGTFVKTSA